MAEPSGLQFTLTIEGLTDPSLQVVSFTGQEALSTPFAFTVQLASRNDQLDAATLIDQPATLTVWQDGVTQQRWSGIVSTFTRGDTGFHHTRYALTLVPALKRLSLRQNSRIFQQLNAPQIISILLQEMGISEYAFALSESHETREYCVQYRESDLAFVERLAAEEGMYYYVVHQDNKHTVVFTDSTQQAPQLGVTLEYNATAGGYQRNPFVRAFRRHYQTAPTRAQLKDYSFKKPAYSFLQTADSGQDPASYEHYDYPGRYKADTQGKPFSQYRLESLRRNTQTGEGDSTIPQLVSGYTAAMTDHLDEACNRRWLLTGVHHQGDQPQALEEAGGHGATTYHNQFTVIASNLPWRPTPNPKPRVDGPQIATVVGPADEEIYCDDYGRVKVQFPWDRYGNGDDQSSCWIRVAQGWAGSQYGMVTIPRIGHEVIVSFLEGDPDQPIITGRTYHATNPPPYPLPANKTRTVLRTETHQGQGYNELRFEDQAEKEEIFIHAQKDFNSHIEHDRKAEIGEDDHLSVTRNQFQRVKGDAHQTVDGEHRVHVQGDQTQAVDQTLHMKQGRSLLVEAGHEIHLKAGSKMVLESSSEITLSAGGSFVKIDASGVSIVGPAINLNSGGSAGSGSGYAGQIAKLPGDVEAATELKPQLVAPTTPIMTSRLPALANLDVAVMEVCQRMTDNTCPLDDCPCLK
ncbi:type VI secretion system Vgr family protein [Celerinatantimonas diazotrophica]|nr:type VI secretion system tip protein VgrG [Celerinatantimonas diazotrophica]CAG9298330.1 Actin cross-linking toxin VgrG1 [Celerinatantimonas diazotrophica]